jgi:hypothetical protein
MLGVYVVNVAQKSNSCTGLPTYTCDLPVSDTADPDACDLNRFAGRDAAGPAENVPGDNGYARQNRCGGSDEFTPGESIALFICIAIVKPHNTAPLTRINLLNLR